MKANRSGRRSCSRALAVLAVLCAPVVAYTQSPATDLRVQVVRPGLNVITGAGGNVVVWTGADGLVLVDTGLATSSAALVDAVTRISRHRSGSSSTRMVMPITRAAMTLSRAAAQ